MCKLRKETTLRATQWMPLCPAPFAAASTIANPADSPLAIGHRLFFDDIGR